MAVAGNTIWKRLRVIPTWEGQQCNHINSISFASSKKLRSIKIKINSKSTTASPSASLLLIHSHITVNTNCTTAAAGDTHTHPQLYCCSIAATPSKQVFKPFVSQESIIGCHLIRILFGDGIVSQQHNHSNQSTLDITVKILSERNIDTRAISQTTK